MSVERIVVAGNGVNQLANRENLSVYCAYDNPVPSWCSDMPKGRTTKTYRLVRDDEVCTVLVKLQHGKCHAPCEPRMKI